MKKQLRLVLFAVLVMLLVMTTALVACAATEGATAAEEGHYYSVVGSEDGATPRYYTTLAAAVASINEDGCTIEVLTDATEQAWVLDSAYTYTITGGAERKTVTFTSTDSSKNALILISAGNVTIDNLTIVRGEAITADPAAVIYVNAAGTHTVKNVVTSAVVTDTLYLNAAATVNVEGDQTDISGATDNVADFRVKDAVLNVKGGNLTGSGPVFYIRVAVTITVENANIVSADKKAVFSSVLGIPTVVLKTGATVTANNSTVFATFANPSSSITIEGATICLSGESALLHAASTPKASITCTSGTVYLKNGAGIPAAVLDKTDSTNGFDWSKLTLVLTGVEGPCELTEGEYTIASVQDLDRILFSSAYQEAFGGRFANVETGASSIVPLILNGESVVLNITAGEYVLEEGFFIDLQAGTLNIGGGTFTGAADAALVSVKGGTATITDGTFNGATTILSVTGGTLNLNGGTFNGAASSAALNVEAGTVNLAGATVLGGADGSVALITGGAVNYVSGTYRAGAEGKVFDVQGGTFNIDGAGVRLEQHRYALLAPGENATPKYYSTFAGVIAAMDADGYTVTVLTDVTEQAWVLDSAYTYTITGGAERKTVTFTSTDSSKKALILISAGNVTIENLTIVRGEAITANPAAVIYVNAAGTHTVKNVVTSAVVTDTLYLNAAATVNVEGAQTDISGATDNVADLRVKDAVLNVKGGKLTGGGPVFYIRAAVTITVENANIVSADKKAVFSNVMGIPTVVLKAGATVTANNSTVFANFANANSSITIEGATICLSGESAILHAASTPKASITCTSGTVYLKNGAGIPAAVLDKTDSTNGFDWSKLSLTVSEIPGSCELTEGEYTIGSLQAAMQFAKENFLDQYESRFPNLVIEGDNLVPFVLNGEGVVLNITAGDFVLSKGFLVEVKLGTLNISGGTFTGAADTAILSVLSGTVNITDGAFNGVALDVQGGTVNLNGGTFTGADNSTILFVRGGAVYLDGAALVGGVGGAVGSITGGDLYYVSGTYSAGENGKTFDVQGGAFHIDGSTTQLSAHLYMLVASGEGAVPRYYTTLASAIAAIDADGYTVKILTDVTESGWMLDRPYAYTVIGATDGLTVTFIAANGDNDSLINISAGKVTLSNVSFERHKDFWQSVDAFVCVSGEAELALNGVKANVSVVDNLYIAAKATVTVSGETVIGGFSGSFANVCASNVSISVSGGAISGAKLFSVLGMEEVAIRVENAELRVSDKLLHAENAGVSLQLLAGTVVRATNATLFSCSQRAVDAVLNGATVYFAGEGAMVRDPEANMVNVTAVSGTLYLDENAPELVACLGTTTEDWSAIVFYLSNLDPAAGVKFECNYTITSQEQLQEMLLNQAWESFRIEYGTLFPLAQPVFAGEIEVSAGLVINHPNATVTLSGTFALDSDVLITLKAGTLNVVGGTYTIGGTACLIDYQGGTLNITDGSFNGTAGVNSELIRATGTEGSVGGKILISGGTFKIFTVVQAGGKVEITVSGGQFGAIDETVGSNTFQINHAEASLSITNGTFAHMANGIWAQKGTVSISGGHFITRNSESLSQHVTVNGQVTVHITGDPVFELSLDHKNQHCVYVDSGSEAAVINVEGGTFGDSGQTYTCSYCFFINGKLGALNLSGGTLYGGISGGAAIIVYDDGGGSTVNISGTTEIYCYVNVYLKYSATVNVSGGSFNPHPKSAQNIMFKVLATSTGSEINVSGGTFNDYMKVFEVASVSTINVSGGTFNERTVCGADNTKVEAFAHITVAATFNVLKVEGTPEPVINLGYSSFANEDGTYEYIGVAFKVNEGAGATLSFSGGIFNIEEDTNLIFDVTTGSVDKITITGGTFYVSGNGAELLPRELFDVEGNQHVLTGANIHLSKSAILPIYNYIDSYGLNLTVMGKYYVPSRVMIRNSFKGEDPEGNGFVISNMKDVESMLMAQFASFTVDGAMSCISPYILFAIDGEDVVVTLLDFTDSYDVSSLIQVYSGTLKVKGGSYNAKAYEHLFEILGDATLTITGGSYNVKGAGSYMIYVAEGVSTENISVSGATIEVAEFGNVPLYATFNVTAEKLTIYGMSEILLNEAKVYTISSYADLTTYLKEELAKKFSAKVTVDIKTWVPLRVDNKDAKFVITGGTYNCTMDFMFAIAAGEIEITGGSFTNNAGDIIRVLGPDVKITINLPNDSQNGMRAAGSIVSAVDAKNVNITVLGGRFNEYTRDTSENLKKALFVLDSTGAAVEGATLTISVGSFTATRALYVGKNVDATVTISDGTFTSNYSSSYYTRINTAHMLVLESATARLTINGGSFDNKYGNYVIAQLTEAGSSTVIGGGTFNGGSGWFYTDAATTLTINENADATKNPVFKDTYAAGLASCGYVYLNCADAVVTVNAGSFTYGCSYEPVFRVQAGKLVLNNAVAKGYLFYVTESSDVTVNDGAYTASGAGATLVNLVGDNVTAEQFDITKALSVGVENNASFFETTLTKAEVLALLSDLSFVVNGNVRLSMVVELTRDETWNTMADAQHIVAEFFSGSNAITFETAGVYSLCLTGDKTITVNGGDHTFYGATLLTLSGGADLVIKDGTYVVEGGHIVRVLGDGTTITIGNASDSNVAPELVVDGGNAIRNEGAGSTIVIYNGSFVHGKYVGETLKSVINTDEPLFYFGESASKSTLTIHNGYYEATCILSDNKGKVGVTIENGTFKSNYVAANMTSMHYGSDGKTPLVAELALSDVATEKAKAYLYSLFYFVGADSTLSIKGGSFDGGFGYAIFGLFDVSGSNVWTIEGGTFNGGHYWVMATKALTLNIKNQVDGDGKIVAKPTFTDGKAYTYHGFDLPASAKLNISGGKFTMRDTLNHHMFYFTGAVTTTVTGGEFLVSAGNRFDADKQLQNDTVIFIMGATKQKLTISGGTFTGVRIIYDSKGSCTFTIEGGNFISNAVSYDDASMIRVEGKSSTLKITGGTFTGNTYTATLVLFAGDGPITADVLGGTFNMGIRWIASSCTNLTLNVGEVGKKGPSFLGLSDGTGSDVKEGKAADATARGFYASTEVQTFNFYSCYIRTEADQQFAIFYRAFADMTFYEDVVIESGGPMFSLTGGTGSIRFVGGTYICHDIGAMFSIKASPKAVLDIVFEGGTFSATGSADLFAITATNQNINLTIKDGTFSTTGIRMFYINGMGMNLVIEDGEFSTSGSHMIELVNNSVPFIIRGGTFTMLEKEGMNSDDAVIYATGKLDAAINIEGGTFFDKRTNGKQMIFKYNPRAVINMSGSFKMYSAELRDYFFYDYDDPTCSLIMSTYTPEELYDNQYYYTCFGYYTRYAPVITKSPMLYAQLGGEGIMYTASVPAATAKHLATLGKVSYGTLIFPTEFLEDGWQNGTDFIAALDEYADNMGRSYDSVYTIVNAVNGLTTEADGSLTIRAALVNIKETNYTRSLTGIAFAKVTDTSGKETYYYASHVSAGVSSDMRSIAKAALNDLQAKPINKDGRVYCYASIMQQNKFSRYTTIFQDALRKYLPKEDRKPKF